jgi:hypothetical protein
VAHSTRWHRRRADAFDHENSPVHALRRTPDFAGEFRVVQIPRRIIQTAKHRTLTLKQRAFAANVKLLNPDFEWCFFDDSDIERFVDREFPQYRQIFDAYPSHIQRLDFFRYLAGLPAGRLLLRPRRPPGHRTHRPASARVCLSVRGPDLESSAARLRHGLGNRQLCVRRRCWPPLPWRGHRQLRQGTAKPGVGSADDEGIPLLSRSEYSVLYTTGPGLVSRTFAENADLASSVTVLFPEDVCDAGNWNRFGDYGVHLMEGSWRNSGYLRRRVTQRLEAAALKKVVDISRRLGPTRAHVEIGR